MRWRAGVLHCSTLCSPGLAATTAATRTTALTGHSSGLCVLPRSCLNQVDSSLKRLPHRPTSSSSSSLLPLGCILTMASQNRQQQQQQQQQKQLYQSSPKQQHQPPPLPDSPILFGPFDVSTQVFYTTPLSFALVNLKPLLPGHVLVCPRRLHRRLTDLDRAELADLWTAVQVVQQMLAVHYFGADEQSSEQTHGEQTAQQAAQQADEQQAGKRTNTQQHTSTAAATAAATARGSFNIAVQVGPEAGQTVAHVHVHVIPRIRGATAKDATTEGDALYEQMATEPGNVGGAQWDAATAEEDHQHHSGSTATSPPTVPPASPSLPLGRRPLPGGRFPRIEDSQRLARTMADMEAEAQVFRQVLARLGYHCEEASL